MSEAERRAEAERALKNAREHGAVGDSFLTALSGVKAGGDGVERWGTAIGRGLAVVFVVALLWSLFGLPLPF